MNKKNQAWFITGTDTGIGKTWCSVALIKQLKQQGLRVAAMKPIASGKNSDAEQILAASGLDLPYELVNPYAFEPAIAPHIAAQQVGQTIELKVLIEKYKQLAALADAVVIEGSGGWRVPINASQSFKDMVLAINAKVILVVGLRLGCINHALLTAEAIQRDGCTLAAWIANPIDSEFDGKASIETISSYLGTPLKLISQ
jgi:dethiobiotin synthetase